MESSETAVLQTAVTRWLKSVPLYRRPGLECFDSPSRFFFCFQQLPTIDKGDIRRGFPRNFVASEAELDRLVDAGLVELERTSGTSEAPTPLLLPLGWWNRQEETALRLNPQVGDLLRPGFRRVTLNSPFCSGDICFTGTPPRSERILGTSLYVNLNRHPFLWTEATLARMAEETLDWNPLFLDVDPVYGVLFALYCERQGIRLPSLRFVVSTYEYLSVVHKRIFERIFKVPVYNLYGSTETGHLLMENLRGEMIPSPAIAHLEILNPDEAGIGDLVVTTLTNDYMPLIRYNIGDLMRAEDTGHGPVYEMHGRAKDSLLDARGQRVTVKQVDSCFNGAEGIVHYQLRHEDGYKLFCVGENNAFSETLLGAVKERLEALLGIKNGVEIRQVDYIPCEASGKYRLIIPPS
jgi:phenylacetate-CoA ligase